MVIRSPKTFCSARKTPEMERARCPNTPTYPVFCSTPSSSGVMLVETALGEVQKLKMKTAKCGENAGFGAKVRSGAAEVYGNLKMCDCACAIQIDRSLPSG